MTFSQLFKFLRTYLLKHPLYVAVYGFLYFQKKARYNVYFCDEGEVSKLLREGKSIVRFGDGEINMMLDLKNHYQVFSPEIKSMLRTIISRYDASAPYVLSIPRFVNFSNDDLRSIGKLNVWLPFKVMFALVFPKKIPYVDAHSFYYDQYFERVVAPLFAGKQVVLITKKDTIDKQLHNDAFPWKNARFVIAPEHDALDAYEDIKGKLSKELTPFEKNDVLLLVALGPVGKYLVYQYAAIGYQGVDVGRGLETVFTDESIEHLSI